MAALMGKKVIVIGGSSGIGLGVAEAAVKRGAELMWSPDRRNDWRPQRPRSPLKPMSKPFRRT